MTIQEFITAEGLRVTVKPVSKNPHIDPDDWAHGARHWLVRIFCRGRRMSVYFSQGAAHTEPPTAADVLDCLASDASTLDSVTEIGKRPSFELWAADLGYSTDSRRAERTFRVVRRQAAALERILGHDAFIQLLFDVERL